MLSIYYKQCSFFLTMQIITKTNKDNIRLIIGNYYDYSHRYNYLSNSLKNVDLFFAEPIIGTNTILWQTPINELITNFNKLSILKQNSVNQYIKKIIIFELNKIAENNILLSKKINKYLTIPNTDNIYVSENGNAIKIILTQWGSKFDDFNRKAVKLDAIPFNKKESAGTISQAKPSPKRKPKKIEESKPLTTTNQNTTTHTFSFDLDINTYKINLNLTNNLYKYFQTQQKAFIYQGKVPPKNWEVKYHTMFLNKEKDNDITEEIIKKLKKIALKTQFSLVEVITAFVQGAIEYQHSKINDINRVKYYPYETLYQIEGVCEDTSILLAKLLISCNYEVVFLSYERAKHLAIAIKVNSHKYSSYTYKKKYFAYIETTSYSRIAKKPEKLAEDIKLNEKANILLPEINGKKEFHISNDFMKYENEIISKYKKEYFAISADGRKLLIKICYKKNELELIKNQQEQLNKELKSLKQKLNTQTVIDKYNKKVNEFNLLNNKVEQKQNEHNKLVEVLNQINKQNT